MEKVQCKECGKYFINEDSTIDHFLKEHTRPSYIHPRNRKKIGWTWDKKTTPHREVK